MACAASCVLPIDLPLASTHFLHFLIASNTVLAAPAFLSLYLELTRRTQASYTNQCFCGDLHDRQLQHRERRVCGGGTDYAKWQ
jgi:hypothetical protein